MTDPRARSPAPPLDAHTRIVRTADQVSAELEGETVVLAMGEGVYYGLDRVGSRVWVLAATPITLGALQEAIVVEYDVAPGTAWEDLLRLVRDLLGAGLVERVSAQAS